MDRKLSPDEHKELLELEELDRLESEHAKAAKQASEPKTGAGEAALEGFGQSATLGYLPKIQAAVEPAQNKLMDFFSGNETESKPYDERLAENRTRQALQEKEHPIASTAGAVGGAVAGAGAMTAPLRALKLVKPAVSLMGKALQGGAAAGVTGALREVDDDTKPQIPQRLENAFSDAKMGGALAGAGHAVGKGVEALKGLGKGLTSAGNERAVKSAGAMLKDYRQLYGKGRLDEVGEAMHKEGLLNGGPGGVTVDKIAEKSKALKDEVGKKIGAIYDKVKLSVNPADTEMHLMNAVAEKAPKIGTEAYNAKMEGVIKDIVKQSKDFSDPRRVNEVIGEIDGMINHGKRVADLPANEQGLFAIRKTLRDNLNKAIEATGDKELIGLNKRYGNLSDINRMSSDKVARENANRFIGLNEMAGGVVGAGLGMGQNPDDMAGAAAKGLAGALLMKGANRYGAPMVSKGFRAAGKGVSAVANPLSSALDRVKISPAQLGAGISAVRSKK